ncbi:HD domain-containing protein [Orientia tsutsugamushi]|uniref:HD domain-containing protein n=1 Tax=Orientia tsutsugamushi TaxID=784 RepID=UPI0011BA6751
MLKSGLWFVNYLINQLNGEMEIESEKDKFTTITCNIPVQLYTGEPYYMHPLEVARMVADYSFETDAIITAILHDTLEDTTLTKEKIVKVFGKKIAEQVSDLTRIKDNKKISSREMIQTFYRQNKTELLLIKLFDRFHNIQTVSIKPYEKRQEIILETQQEFIPLAQYLKLPEIGEQLCEYCKLNAS